MSSTSKVSPQEKQEALERLREWMPPGSTVYCVLRHRSRSGMQRQIGVVVMTPEGPRHPNYAVGAVLGLRVNERGDGVFVNGCGMDMGWHLVFSLSSALYPDGFGCTGEGCHSNDHGNGDRDYTPNSTRQTGWETCDDCCLLSAERRASNHGCEKHSHWHRSGAYALRAEWI